MTNISENVILTITRKPDIYLGPQYPKDSNLVVRYSKNFLNKENEKINRKKRILEWYELDDDKSHQEYIDKLLKEKKFDQ